MIKEAEEFAAEDAASKRRIEALNGLSTFVWQLKSQVSDPAGLDGKLESEEKDVIREELRSVNDWLEEHGQSATTEEVEERLAELQAVVNPITTRLYQDGAAFDDTTHSAPTDYDDDESDPYRHVEL